MPKPSPDAGLLTVPQAAQRLAVSRMTVYRLLSGGSLEGVKLPTTPGGKRRPTRITAASVERLITQGKAAARRQWRG